MIVPPAVFGHEFAGDIDAVGDGVAGWARGMRVVAANSAPCMDCFYCLRGRHELCEDLLFLNGAYAEYIVIPERIVRLNLHRIPDHVTYQAAAAVEPLACVVRGMELTPVESGDTVDTVDTVGTESRNAGESAKISLHQLYSGQYNDRYIKQDDMLFYEKHFEIRRSSYAYSLRVCS